MIFPIKPRYLLRVGQTTGIFLISLAKLEFLRKIEQVENVRSQLNPGRGYVWDPSIQAHGRDFRGGMGIINIFLTFSLGVSFYSKVFSALGNLDMDKKIMGGLHLNPFIDFFFHEFLRKKTLVLTKMRIRFFKATAD